MTDFSDLREAMVREQIERRGIGDAAILSAFRAVPREKFVPAELAQYAYSDGPLPIGHEQTISQPYIVALMIEAAGIRAGDRVLEVGAGSGYAAAVAGQIAAKVVAIERQPDLVADAKARILALGVSNVEVRHGDGTVGCPGDAPFSAILVAAASGSVPEALLGQLAPGGRLVIPIGARGQVQQLTKVTKRADGSLLRHILAAVRFVPLVVDS